METLCACAGRGLMLKLQIGSGLEDELAALRAKLVCDAEMILAGRVMNIDDAG